MVPDDLIRHLEELLRADPGLALPSVYGVCGHPVFPPVAAVVTVVQQQRLQVVQGVGKLRLRRLVGLELVKQGNQLFFLILRQQKNKTGVNVNQDKKGFSRAKIKTEISKRKTF